MTIGEEEERKGKREGGGEERGKGRRNKEE